MTKSKIREIKELLEVDKHCTPPVEDKLKKMSIDELEELDEILPRLISVYGKRKIMGLFNIKGFYEAKAKREGKSCETKLMR